MIVALLLCNCAIAQSDLFLNFNSTHSGRNLSLTWSKHFHEKNEFGLGLRYNINMLAHPDDQDYVYRKRLYATKPYHHIGAEIFYNRKILKIFSNVETFAFYNAQISYSTTRNKTVYGIVNDENGNAVYKEDIEYFGPFTWLEQNIGLGYKVPLANNWYLQHKIGYGTTFIMGHDDVLTDKIFNWFSWEFGYLINVGVGYRFQ